jgi:poly [ADP-ribose] polymerase
MAVTNEKGFKYAKLICVSSDNNNKEYLMEQISDNEFKFSYGRVGQNMTTGTKSMSQWDKVYKDKTNKKGEASYKDVTHLFTESVSNTPAQVASNTRKYEEFKTGRPAAVKDFVKLLQSYANKSVQQNYKVEVANVTQAQVDQAQAVLNGVAKESQKISSVRTVNDALLELYSTIPRKMGKVQDHLLSAEELDVNALQQRLNSILNDEQKTLDVMAGQVALQSGIKNASLDASDTDALTSDLLDAAGLDMEPVTSDEERMIRGMMADHKSKFKRAFRVVNTKSQALYDVNLKGAADKKTQLFWHGSRSENWWSIAQSGLLIRPSSAVYSGSMFGDGIYGADKFQKSLGYTSYAGSYWAKGGEKRAFLALFDFHVGKQLVISAHNSECYKYSKAFLKQKGGYDSTYAKAGVSLHNNEYIVYDPAQCTIKYLIEIE